MYFADYSDFFFNYQIFPFINRHLKFNKSNMYVFYFR